MPLIDNYLLNNYGLDGFDKDKELKMIAQGALTSSNSGIAGNSFDTRGSTANSYYINLGFAFPVLPKLVIVKTNSGSPQCVFVQDLKNSFGDSICFTPSSGGLFLAVSTTTSAFSFFVTTSLMKLPTALSNTNHTWEAYA
ncbi:hypothetical protein V6669_06370 [Paenibacillus sp. Y5S-9]|uniref:hypothetical protein n=1 Tax=Paenibacillus sp. Y5S-9 TaxID=3122489 RepID=UPI0030CEF882